MTNKSSSYGTIDSFYEWIEQAKVFTENLNSSGLKKLINETEDLKIKENLTCEMYVLDFMLQDGKLKGIYQTTDNEGKTTYEYPCTKDISAEMIQYLLIRLEETKNLTLKIRYAQVIVSCADKKNAGKAIPILIDTYIAFIETYILQADEDGYRSYTVKTAFENMFYHVILSGYRKIDAKKLLHKLIFEEKHVNLLFRSSLIEYMTEQKKHFTKTEFLNTLHLCDELYWLTKNGEVRIVEDFIKAAILVCNICKSDKKVWHNRLGELHEKEMNGGSNDASGMGPIIECLEAIDSYQMAGNKEKVDELSVKYTMLRENLKFGKVQHEFDGSQLNKLNKLYKDYERSVTEHIIKLDSHDILSYVIQAHDLWPKLESIRNRVKSRKHNFMDMVSNHKIDINKNLSKTITTKEDHELDNIYQSYNIHIQLFTNHQLYSLFRIGFLYNKVTYQSVISFLQKHTWIGQPIAYKNSEGETKTYTWLSVIAPALYEIFTGFHSYFKKRDGFINVVLPLDSLVLKFEGMLRDFARLLGAKTIVSTKGYTREVYIEDLLQNEKIKEHFNESDLMLFNYVFVSKHGLNLRNNIAHGFYRYNQYTIDKLFIALVCVLKLGIYKFEPKDNKENQH